MQGGNKVIIVYKYAMRESVRLLSEIRRDNCQRPRWVRGPHGCLADQLRGTAVSHGSKIRPDNAARAGV